MKMKALSLVLAAVTVIGTLSGCGSNGVSADARKTFTVGFDAEFPPYGYMDDAGNYVGFDLDLAEEVCKRKGWELKKQPIDWDAKDMELSSGAIDCIWNGFTIQGREDQYTWSIPYVDNSQVFVVKTDSGIASQADLAGKKVGVQKDSSALAALEGDASALAATFAELTQYADYNTAFMDLEAGAIEAGAEELVNKVKGGWTGFDVCVATPDMMGMLGKGLGRVLGPKMPNPKAGTVTKEIGKTVKELKLGKVQYRGDKQGTLHSSIGKRDFGAAKLAENLAVLLDAVIKAKPATAKGTYLRSVTLTSTMGPSVRIDPLKIPAFLQGK